MQPAECQNRMTKSCGVPSRRILNPTGIVIYTCEDELYLSADYSTYKSTTTRLCQPK
jgi:hypothetical protein